MLRGWWLFSVQLKLEVLVDDCDCEQGEVWKVRKAKAKARAAWGGELVTR